MVHEQDRQPDVRFILRSPLHGLMSASFLLVTYHGRKSGKSYTLPANYARVGKTIYIVPGMHEQKTWWRNLRGGAPVTLTLDRKPVSGAALVLEDDREAIADALGHYAKAFPPSAKMYGICLETDGTDNRDDLLKAAQSMIVVKVEVEG